jgi:hypothetical protein
LLKQFSLTMVIGIFIVWIMTVLLIPSFKKWNLHMKFFCYVWKFTINIKVLKLNIYFYILYM